MLVDRLASLQRKHKHLHDKIEALVAEKAPEKYISSLKKEKLALKDEMSFIMRQLEQNEA